MAVKLKASVGIAITERKAARNNPADILLLRSMLRANGLKVRPDGKMEAGLQKAIVAAQKKAGLNIPDGVVDPGAKTFRFLLPKYQKQQSQKGSEFKVKLNGKVLTLDPKSKADVDDYLFKQISPGVSRILSRHESSMTLYQEYLDTAMMKDGLADAVMQVMSIKLGKVKWPKSSTVSAAQKATSNLRVAVRSRNIMGTRKAMVEAEKAVNQFNLEMSRFQAGIIGGAEKNVKALQLTSDASFAIFEALATAVLTPSTGTNADNVAATSAAFLKSTAQQLGKHIAGQDVDPKWAAANVLFETAFAGLTSYLGSAATKKIDLNALTKAGGPKLAKYLRAQNFPVKLTNKQAEKLMRNHILGAAEQALNAAISEAFAQLKKLAKKGKSITSKDILDSVSDYFSKVAAAALVGSFWKFQNKVPKKVRKNLSTSYAPGAVKTILRKKKWKRLTNKMEDQAIADAMKAVEKELGAASISAGAEAFVDNPNKDISDEVALVAMKDKNLLKKFDTALEKAVARQIEEQRK